MLNICKGGLCHALARLRVDVSCRFSKESEYSYIYKRCKQRHCKHFAKEEITYLGPSNKHPIRYFESLNPLCYLCNEISNFAYPYSLVVNRQGAFTDFSNFFRPNRCFRTLKWFSRKQLLIKTFLLLNCFSFNTFLAKTPIWHLFGAFLPYIIHLLTFTMIVLLRVTVNLYKMIVHVRPPRLSRASYLLNFQKVFPPFIKTPLY